MDEFSKKFRNRNRFLNIISVIVVQLLGLGINFFLSPYLANSIDKSAYGFVALANSFTSYASLITIALNSMASRFIIISLHQNNLKNANRYFSSTLFSNLILSALFLIFGAIFTLSIENLIDIPKHIITDVQLLFALIFLTFIVQTASSIFNVCYYAIGKLYILNLRTMESTFLRLFIIIMFFSFLPARVLYIGIAALLASLYLMVFNISFSRKNLPFLTFNLKDASFGATKELLSSGVWNTLNSLGTTLTEGLDLLFCNLFIGADAMGMLAFSKTIPTALKGLMSSLGTMFAPEIMHDYAKGNNTLLKNTLYSSMRVVGIILNVLVSCFLGFGIPFYRLWLPMYNSQQLYMLTLLSMLATTFSTSVSPVYNVFIAANRIKIPAIAHVLGGLVSTIIVLILLATTNIGLYAIAGVSSIIEIVKIIVYILPYGSNLLNEKKWHLNKFSIKSALSIWSMAIIGVVFTQFVMVSNWLIFFLFGSIYALIVLSFNFLVFFSKSERAHIKREITRKLRKQLTNENW